MPTDTDFPEANPSTSYRPVVRLALLFGGAVGALCGLWLVFLHLSGNNAFGPKQLLVQLLVPLVAVAAEWWLRQRVRPGRPGLGRSLGVGVLTVLVAAVLAAGSTWGLAQAVGDTALVEARREAREISGLQYRGLPKENQNPALHQANLQQIDKLQVSDIVGGTFVQVLLIGLVLAVPAGIFLRE